MEQVARDMSSMPTRAAATPDSSAADFRHAADPAGAPIVDIIDKPDVPDDISNDISDTAMSQSAKAMK